MAMRRDSKAPVPNAKRPVKARATSLAASASPPLSRKTPGAGPAVAGGPKAKQGKKLAKKPKIARPMNSFMVCRSPTFAPRPRPGPPRAVICAVQRCTSLLRCVDGVVVAEQASVESRLATRFGLRLFAFHSRSPQSGSSALTRALHTNHASYFTRHVCRSPVCKTGEKTGENCLDV